MAVSAFGLTTTVGGLVFLPAGVSSIQCPPLAATPWDGLNVDSEKIPDLPGFLDEIQVSIPESRFAASWFSFDAGSLSLNLGVVSPTEQDEVSVFKAAGGSAELDQVPWKIVSVPLGHSALEKLQAGLDSFASSKRIAIISEIRPDVGVASATVDATSLDAIQSFADSQDACVVRPEGGDPLAYKGGDGRDSRPHCVCRA